MDLRGYEFFGGDLFDFSFSSPEDGTSTFLDISFFGGDLLDFSFSIPEG